MKTWIRRGIQAIICVSIGAVIAVKINEWSAPSFVANYEVNTDNNWGIVIFQAVTMIGLSVMGYLYGRKEWTTPH
jgi:hypothetical protein